MPLAETIRFSSLSQQVIVQSEHEPCSPDNTMLFSSRVRVTGIRYPDVRVTVRTKSRLVESVMYEPDGAGGLHLPLYAFSPPREPFEMEVVSAGGSVSGYVTIVHPVTTEALNSMQSYMKAPISSLGPSQGKRSSRPLVPAVSGSAAACEMPDPNIEPIFFRRSNTSNFVTGVVPVKDPTKSVITT